MGSCNDGGCLRSASASRPVASFIGRVLRCASSWLESLGKEERDYHAAVRFFIFHRKTRVLEFFFARNFKAYVRRFFVRRNVIQIFQ